MKVKLKIKLTESKLVSAISSLMQQFNGNGAKNNCRGYAAINSGLFPLIKDRRTINNRLDETVATGNEKHYCRILTRLYFYSY